MRRLVLSAVVIAAASGTVAVHGRLVDARAQITGGNDVSWVPPAEHLRPMSLGYREALADLIWIRAVIFSGERVGNADTDALGRYVDAITGLSPRFHRAYVWGGASVVYSAPVVTRPMVDHAIDIYRRGVDEFPESHALLYPLGMLLIHQIGSTPGYDEDERRAAAREGAELIRKAAAFGADPLVRSYAATLMSDHAATEELAIQFLESQLAQTEDPDYRRLLRKKLAELGGEQTRDRVERIRQTFREEHLARAPYLPDTVYALIRSEPGLLAQPPADR